MTTSTRLLQAGTPQKSLQSNIPEYVAEFNVSTAKGLSIQIDGSGTRHVYTIISGDIYHYTFSSTENISDAVFEEESTALFGNIVDIEVRSDGLKGIALISNGNVNEFSFGTAYDTSTITIDATYTTAMNNGKDYLQINQGQSGVSTHWYIGVNDIFDSVQRWSVSTTGWDFSGTWTKEAEWSDSSQNPDDGTLQAEALKGRTVSGDGVGIGVSRFGSLNRYYESGGDGDSLDGTNDLANTASIRPLIGNAAGSSSVVVGSHWLSSSQSDVSKSTLFILIQSSSVRKIVQFNLQGDDGSWGFPAGVSPTVQTIGLTSGPEYMHVSQDGRYAMFVENSSSTWWIWVYEFGTKGDISTLTYVGVEQQSRVGSTTTQFNIYASPDGRKVFQGTAAGEVRMIQFTGGNDWDPASWTGSSQTSFSDPGRILNATDITFSRDGLKMFIVHLPSAFSISVGGLTATLLEYSVSSPFSFTGATFVRSIDIKLGGNVMTANFSNNGRQLYLVSETANSAIQIDLDSPYELPASDLDQYDMSRKVQHFIDDLGDKVFSTSCPKIYEDVYSQKTLLSRPQYAGVFNDVYSVPKV